MSTLEPEVVSDDALDVVLEQLHEIYGRDLAAFFEEERKSARVKEERVFESCGDARVRVVRERES